MLLEEDDPLLELVDVFGCAEAGLVPGLLAELLGQSLFQLLDSAGEPGAALLRVEQVGLQRGSADGRAGAAAGARRLRFGGVDLFEEVSVSVEEGAVDAGALCDAADGDLLAGGGRVVERFQDALPGSSRRGVPRPWPWSVCCRWLSSGALRVDVEHGLTDAGHSDQHGAMSADDGHCLFYLVALVGGEFVEAGGDSCDEAADPGDLFG